MIINGVHIAVTRQWIDDVLRMRIETNQLNINDLFMVTLAPKEALEGDSFIETKYGKLRVFWRNDMPENKLAQILHISKWKYPVKGQKLEIANMTTDTPHTKVDSPSHVPVQTQNSREVDEEVKRVSEQVADELKREQWDTKTAMASGYDKNGDLVN